MGARFDHDNTSRADQSWPRSLGTRWIPTVAGPVLRRERKVVRKSTGTSNEKAAERFLRAQLVDAERDVPVWPEIDRTTYTDLERIVLDDYKANGRLSRVDGRLGHLRDYFGLYKAREIRTDRIVAYVAHRLEEGAKLSTVNRTDLSVQRILSSTECRSPVSEMSKIFD